MLFDSWVWAKKLTTPAPKNLAKDMTVEVSVSLAQQLVRYENLSYKMKGPREVCCKRRSQRKDEGKGEIGAQAWRDT